MGNALEGLTCDDARVVCNDSAECVCRFDPETFCAKETGSTCQCSMCKRLCECPA